MTDKAKGWPGMENTNHWINNQMAVSLLCLDGHVEHQTHVWAQEPAVVPAFLVNYGKWDQWDFSYRIVWNKKQN